ncbi:MAG: SDR family oxidoreductase [Chloroflexaceae bacterium]|nr:SDR family oxidoreductase [Chloroflexaceae bacterium]
MRTTTTNRYPVALTEKTRTSGRLPWLLGGVVGGLLLGRYLRPPRKPPAFRVAGERPGTALITGASSGIGAAFARRLATERYDLILVARREDRLSDLAARLRQQHGVTVEVLVADLANPADVTRVEQCLAACDTLSLLVNNAGFGTSGYFADIDLQRQLDMIHVHVVASVRLTHTALPGMRNRQRGAIINVSSVAASIPGPEMVTYSATKNYLNTFSLALSTELIGTGVQVQALCPGFTVTEFHDSPEFQSLDRSHIPSWAWMSAHKVVDRSLQALEQGKVICHPDRRYRLLAAVVTTPPVSTLLLHYLRKHRPQPNRHPYG